MFPCCGYDPGLAAYMMSLDWEDKARAVNESGSLDAKLAIVALGAVTLAYGLLFAVT